VTEQVHPLGGRVAVESDPLAVEKLERQAARWKSRPGGSWRLGQEFAGRLEWVGLPRLLPLLF
jgi:hypothetical protein